MKYVKMLGLAAVAAAALMAFAGASSASADVLCTTTTTPCTATVGGIQTVNVGVVKITTSYKTIECTESKVNGTVTKDGAGGPVLGNINTLDFAGCNCTVTTVKPGTFSATNIKGTDNGTMTFSGSEIETTCSTPFGSVHCIYVTNNTHIGVLTGGTDATLHAEEADFGRLITNELCAEKAKWDATYTITNHSAVYVEPS